MPRQPANQTRAHPAPPGLSPPPHAGRRAYAVLAAVSGCCPPVQGRLPTRYSPVRHWAAPMSAPKSFHGHAPFDLHVLGTPPAFILSQDQTLTKSFFRPAILPMACLAYCSRLHLSMPVLLNVLQLCCRALPLTRCRDSFQNLSRLFHCSAVKVLPVISLARQLLYISTAACVCQ